MKQISYLTIPFLLSTYLNADSSLALSYVKTTGNTDSTVFNALGKTKQSIDATQWYDAKLDAQYGKTNGNKDADKFIINANYNKTISNALYYFIALNYKNDKFSGYDYKASIGPGLGYSVLKNDMQNLDLKLGVLYAKDKLENGRSDSYALGENELNYEHKLNDTVTISQNLKYSQSLENSKNYTASSQTGIKSKMTDKLSLGLSYTIDYTNLVPNNVERTDKKFLTSLIVNF